MRSVSDGQERIGQLRALVDCSTVQEPYAHANSVLCRSILYNESATLACRVLHHGVVYVMLL